MCKSQERVLTGPAWVTWPLIPRIYCPVIDQAWVMGFLCSQDWRSGTTRGEMENAGQRMPTECPVQDDQYMRNGEAKIEILVWAHISSSLAHPFLSFPHCHIPCSNFCYFSYGLAPNSVDAVFFSFFSFTVIFCKPSRIWLYLNLLLILPSNSIRLWNWVSSGDLNVI